MLAHSERSGSFKVNVYVRSIARVRQRIPDVEKPTTHISKEEALMQGMPTLKASSL